MQPVSGELDPAQAGATATSRSEGPPDLQRVDHGTEVGEGARESGAPYAIDGDHVRSVEGGDVMDDDWIGVAPAMTASHADLEGVSRLKPVEAM
jgi:hypothetical protein